MYPAFSAFFRNLLLFQRRAAAITAEKSSDTQVKIKIQTQSATTDLL
jgi:hypothetical protein